MAVSPGQRLRKAAAKAAKRKQVVAEKLAQSRRELAIAKPRHVDLATSPIVDCSLMGSAEEAGMSTLTLVRKLTLGRYAVAVFLIDFYCLGIKDAFFQVRDAEEYEDMREEMEATGMVAPIEPARARLLLREAVAFGAANGFPPPPDFAEMERLFGAVEPAGEPFAFGDNGRPHYIVGPKDTKRRMDYILAVLTEKLGPDGFDVSYPLDDEYEEEEE